MSPPSIVEDSNIKKNEAVVTIDDSGHKKVKMTYAEATRCRSSVLAQNEKIRLGIHPADNE
jgi:hypothetical protein